MPDQIRPGNPQPVGINLQRDFSSPQYPQSPQPAMAPPASVANGELIQYLVNMGITPAIAAQLAVKISTQTPTDFTRPLANGVKLQTDRAGGNLHSDLGGLSPDAAAALMAEHTYRIASSQAALSGKPIHLGFAGDKRAPEEDEGVSSGDAGGTGKSERTGFGISKRMDK